MAYTIPTKDEIENFKRRPGRPATYEELSPQAINAIVNRLFASSNLSQHAEHVIEFLAHGGVMSSDQLGFLVATSTLNKYAEKDKRIVDRLPFSATELQPIFAEHGLAFTEEETGLYVLGPVGLEIARRRLEMTPVTGHMAYRLERIMHDVITNEIVLRLHHFCEAQEWRVAITGTNSGALWNADYSHKILEPDALVTVQKASEEPRLFCIEYHNEDWRTRAERKVDKYELVRVNNEKIWQINWETDTFPAVLVVFKNRIVGEGYRDKLETEQVGVQFYGKLLPGIMQDNLAEWVNFTRGERETLFA